MLTSRRLIWSMDFKLKAREKCGKNILREKQTINKGLLMFVDVKMLTER